MRKLLFCLFLFLPFPSNAGEPFIMPLGLEQKAEALGVSTVTLEKANELFQNLVSGGNIPFGYVKDGCYARAHVMSRMLEEEGVISGKVFLEGRLQAMNPYSRTGSSDWFYHVATILLVRVGEKVEITVFDPSLFTLPVSLNEWISIQVRHEKGLVRSIAVANRFAYRIFDKEGSLQEYRKGDWENALSYLRQQRKKLEELQRRNQR